MAETNTNAQDEIGLLDVVVIFAENWFLLFVAPILVGLVAFAAFSFATPRTFDSVALLRIDATEAAMLLSARVLNPALVGSSYLKEYEGSFSRARQILADDLLAITQEGESDLYRVRVRYKSADGSQELLTNIIRSLIANSTPTPSEAKLLEINIEQAKRSIAELELNLERTNRLAESMEGGSVLTGATIGELGQALVAFVANIEDRHARIFRLEEALRGSVSDEDVIQTATLPDSPNSTGAVILAVLVAFSFGLTGLLFSFISAGWRRASRSAGGLYKLNRIRHAFGVKPKELI